MPALRPYRGTSAWPARALRAVIVGAGLVGGVAMLVQAALLAAAVGDSGYGYLRWPSFVAVPLTIVIPWLAAR